MTIVRNGTEIKLTDNELRLAYIEQQHEYDMEAITYELECIIEDDEDDVEVEYAKQIVNDHRRLSAAAKNMRTNIDKWDMNWDNAVRDAAYGAITAKAISDGFM